MKRNAASCWLAAALTFASRLGGEGVPPAVSSEAPAAAAALPAAAADFFRDKVHPLLEAKCFGCHGEPKDREGEFEMRTREGLLKGGESGEAALVPGDPDKSRMFEAVLRRGKLKMPPKERNKLETEEIEVLRQWIAGGAPWAEPKGGKPRWEYKPEDIWAFQPLRKQETGDRKQETGEKNAIDAFIGAKLSGKGLKVAPAADRVTLIRRATYDLIGLPPTPAEIDAFVKDRSPDAFDKVVERLLASPHYGEQWGRHWLDVVRYADTDGFSNDYERPNAWRYRDYVIRSFNGDKPYNQFILEQIAGDELADTEHGTRNTELLLGTGLLRMGPWEHTAMSVAAVTRQLFLDDVTHNVSATFLGLTVGCARCHDHKFDPIPTKDYYRLQSVYAPVQFETRKVAFLPSENTLDFDTQIAGVRASLTNFQARLQAIRRKHDRAVKAFLKEQGFAALKEVPLSQRPPRELGLTSTDQSLEKTLQKRIEYCERELQRYQPLAFGVSSGGLEKPEPTPALNILVGGSLEAPGEAVTPGVLTAVVNRGRADPVVGQASRLSEPRLGLRATSAGETPGAAGGTPAPLPGRSSPEDLIPQTDGARRLALAKWIASPDNPLTARVMVNRIWQWHFGQGLVATPNNFGKMGKRPTHPELLDWLAHYFIEHGWSIKEMHRLVMRSATYQQSAKPEGTRTFGSAARPKRAGALEIANPLFATHVAAAEDSRAPEQLDPENKLLWHFPPRRLSAEELRDSMLQVSGELSGAMGGAPVFPEINLEAALQPRHIMGGLAPPYKPSPTREQRNRRTIYTAQIRTLINPMLQVFNEPVTDVSCEQRDATTVTPQVFALFNSQCAHDFALAMAVRLEKTSHNRSKQIGTAFRLAYGRLPTKQEKQMCARHLDQMTSHQRQNKPAKFEFPPKLVRSMIEEMTGENFEFEEDWDMSKYEYNLQPTEVSAETRALADLCLVLMNANEFVYVY